MAGRDSNGNVSHATGVPVVGGTTISSSVMNAELEMIRAELEDSLSRSGKGGLTQPLRLPDGSVAAPGLAFTQETGSGWYRASAGAVRLARLGVDVLGTISGGVGALVWGTLTATSAIVRGAIADGASAVGVIIDNSVTLANAAAKIASFRNNTVEKAAVDLDGRMLSPAYRPLAAGAATVSGTAADGATAVGVVVDNTVALADAAAKLLSIKNAGTEKAYVDKDGSLNAFGVVASSAISGTTVTASATTNLTPTAGANWTLTAVLARKSAGLVYLSVQATASASASFASILTMPVGNFPLTIAPKGILGVFTDASAGPLSYAGWFDLSTSGTLSLGYYDNGTSLVPVPSAAVGDVVFLTLTYPVV